jgi:hypothetical protein
MFIKFILKGLNDKGDIFNGASLDPLSILNTAQQWASLEPITDFDFFINHC